MNKDSKDVNGKQLTAVGLENNATEMENNLETVNKHVIIKMLKVLNSIMTILKQKEDGIFKVLIKWFRLYLKLHIMIDPDDKNILNFYENTVPTIITYIIGCLQYKPRQVPNYHFDLLEILEELIKSIEPSVLKKITKFERKTIGCLWNAIELAGDFNTQKKALNIFLVLLKEFDENRQNEELNSIKWTNLNFFQEKLKAIVHATKLSHVLENRSRELLNNFNMNLSKTVLVFSFYCEAVTFGGMYKFYKLLKFQKFWIDINYYPKTLSFCGRFKLNSNAKYEIVNVALGIQQISLKSNILQVFFYKPGDFSKYFDYFASVDVNVVEFTLSEEEKQRLISNKHVIEYFNNLSKSNSIKYTKDDQITYDLLKNDMTISLKEKIEKSNDNSKSKPFKNVEYLQNTSTSSKCKTNISNSFVGQKRKSLEDLIEENLSNTSNLFESLKQKSNESPKTSDNLGNQVEKRPIRSVRNKNKIFKSFEMDESLEDFETGKRKRKKSQKRKSRQSKSRYKQVCKVTPTVDLTKIENTQPSEQNDTTPYENKGKTSLNNNQTLPDFNTQDCNEILRQVADIYDVADTTYAKPCQSYRNFRMQTSPSQNTDIAGRKKKNQPQNTSSSGKKRKFNCNSQENKENKNPQTNNTAIELSASSKTRNVMSPYLFDTQGSVEIPSFNKVNIKNILSSSSECEEVRGFNEIMLKDINHICVPDNILVSGSSNATTPRPTSAINVSNYSDSDMEITQINNYQNALNQYPLKTNPITTQDKMELVKFRNNSNAILKQQSEIREGKSANLENNYKVNHLQDHTNSELYSSCLEPIKESIFDVMAKCMPNIDDKYARDCIIFKNRQEDASSSDEEENITNLNDQNVCNLTKPFINKSLVLNHNLYQEKDLSTSQDNSFAISSDLTTRKARKCQVTPNAIIMHRIQVSAHKSIIHRKTRSKKLPKANKCLNDFFGNNKKSLQFQEDNLALQSKNLNIFKETYGTDIIAIHKENSRPFSVELAKTAQNEDAILKGSSNTTNQQSSSTNLDVSRNNENTSLRCRKFNIKHQGATLEDFNNEFKNDVYQIMNDYNTNMNKRLDTIVWQGVKNISDRYRQHFIDSIKDVLGKAENNISELEKIRIGIGKLVRELEWQYDAFINKSKEFNIHKEMCKRILENVKATDVPNFIVKDYEEMFKRIRIEQKIAFQNVWQNLEKQNV